MRRPFAVPLTPHGPAGALDVGLAACGASPTLWLRLTVAGGVPAAILADVAGRTIGRPWATAAVATLFVTAPLGLRIAATAVRGTFGEALGTEALGTEALGTEAWGTEAWEEVEDGGTGRPRVRTPPERTREALLAALGVLLAALFLAPRWLDLPTSFGAWLASPGGGAAVGVTLAAALGLWAWSDLSRRAPFAPSPAKTSAGETSAGETALGRVVGRLGMRALLGWPLALFFVNGGAVGAWVCLILWAPIAIAAAGRRGFRSERAALRSISARLHDEHADDLLKSRTAALAARANGLALFTAGLWLVGVLTVDLVLSALLNWRPGLGAALGGWSSNGPGFWATLADDHGAAALAALGGVGAYVVGRIGWFATLVDLRVRRDCWDVQQAVARERDRLADEERRTSPAGPRAAPRSHRITGRATAAALLAACLAPSALAQRPAADPAKPTDPAQTDPAQTAARTEAVLSREEFRPLRDFAAQGDGLFPPLDGSRSPTAPRGAGPSSGGPSSDGGSSDGPSSDGPSSDGGSSDGGSSGGGTSPSGPRGSSPPSGSSPSGASPPGASPERPPPDAQPPARPPAGPPAGGAPSGGAPAGSGGGALGAVVSTVAVWGAGIVLVAVLLMLIWAVVKGVTNREAAPQTPASAAAGGVAAAEGGGARAPAPAADERLAAARAAAADGRYGDAVGLLLDGLTDRVELAGLIRPRNGLTARDYLRAARPDPALRPALRTVVTVFEPLGYGRRPGRLEQYARAEAAYLAGVSDRPAAASPVLSNRTGGDR